MPKIGKGLFLDIALGCVTPDYSIRWKVKSDVLKYYLTNKSISGIPRDIPVIDKIFFAVSKATCEINPKMNICRVWKSFYKKNKEPKCVKNYCNNIETREVKS